MPAAGSKAALRGVQVFALLTPVVSHGGATLAVTGSHRLAQRVVDDAVSAPSLSSADVRRLLKRKHPWFQSLWTADEEAEREHRLIDEATTIGDIEVRVVEMTGEPGDVILMDPTLLHCMAPHTRGGPRFVVTERLGAKKGDGP
jgi:ectoine hydroxylase-related dioxygenase (phytanoyl-CoA dioxygenase family)